MGTNKGVATIRLRDGTWDVVQLSHITTANKKKNIMTSRHGSAEDPYNDMDTSLMPA